MDLNHQQCATWNFQARNGGTQLTNRATVTSQPGASGLSGIAPILLLSGDSSSNRQVCVSSPAYHIAESCQLQMFSDDRVEEIISQKQSLMFQTFVDRLYTREKVGQISAEIKALEHLIFSRMASELPDLYRELLKEHGHDSRHQSDRTHRDLIEGTLVQARAL